MGEGGKSIPGSGNGMCKGLKEFWPGLWPGPGTLSQKLTISIVTFPNTSN